MGRAIKNYTGYYRAQTSNYYDNASTGYTVPSGKVARIGISYAAYGGSYNARSVGGFYAGGSSASSSNRFLTAFFPTSKSGNNTASSFVNNFYHANTGHYCHMPNRDYNPKCYLMDGMVQERNTSRTSTVWFARNWTDIGNSISYGAIAVDGVTSTTVTNMAFPMFPYRGFDGNSAAGIAGTKYGEVHAFAGETIYIYDFAAEQYTSDSYRAFRDCSWNLFIIEEDAA